MRIAMSASKNIRVLARCNQGGKPDGVQIIVHRGYAYIGHMFSDGVSVVDVRDPLNPKAVAFIANPANTRSHHLQIHDDLMLVVNGANIWAMQQFSQQQDYFNKPLTESMHARSQPF